MDFSGKIVLITGASSGIGAATAVYFAGLGAKLALTGRNEANLQKTVDQCLVCNKESEILSILGDLEKEEDLDNIIQQTIARYEALDVLINNAGVSNCDYLETVTLELYDFIFNTNVRAVLYLTKLALPHLIKSKGCVVNVSSASSLRPMPKSIPYSMSKAALDHFTKCLALDVASKQVRVNSVNPGLVPTGITQNYTKSNSIPEDVFYKAAAKLHPNGRLGKPEETAAAIAFLASDLAVNITGAILTVDGGIGLGFGSK